MSQKTPPADAFGGLKERLPLDAAGKQYLDGHYLRDGGGADDRDS